ncbi:hypothetical protein P875_00086562 [Aspergillus parasiticus SU-1]|uniref:Fungal calcium binding protein domain-containing protein n=1 Tax=Aspergillus parasiticus (strain ATCC 56775 / NRRL 5862 / SRRC 143 / SU-1) TaxID=1403190 RepID=A0A0F0I7H9_ASPPU|nr:hypothetical protein P875_00086562 [Aspergillus parasiticus SU-1]
MRVSTLAVALCASVAIAAPTETPDLHNILQAFNASKIVQDAGPVLESLLVTGNCNIPACFQQLIPAVQKCNAAIVGGGSDIASDLECVSSVIADLVPNQISFSLSLGVISMLVLGWESLVWERRGLRADCTLCYGGYSGCVNW